MKTITKKELEEVLEKWFDEDVIGNRGVGYVGTEQKADLYRRLEKIWKK